ncbi:MAG: protein translocase subunit SecD [Thermoguttaceae bacterium]
MNYRMTRMVSLLALCATLATFTALAQDAAAPDSPTAAESPNVTESPNAAEVTQEATEVATPAPELPPLPELPPAPAPVATPAAVVPVAAVPAAVVPVAVPPVVTPPVATPQVAVPTVSIPEVEATPAGEDETPAPPKNWRNDGRITIAAFALVIIISMFLANWFSRAARLPDYSFRLFVVFLCFFGSFAAVYLGWNRMALGIDLRGGVVLVYDVTPAQGQQGKVDMDALAQAIGRRVNPGGVKEISITKLGENQIKVVIPEAEESEVARIERVISESGALTFRILASQLYPQDQPIVDLAMKETGRQVRGSDGRLLAEWTPVPQKERAEFDSNANLYKRERRGQLEVLVLYNDGCDVTGEFLRPGGVQRDFDQGQPIVRFGFNTLGAHKFSVLTGRNLPDPVQKSLYRQLGIILNDSLYSAPRIQSTISDSGQITFGRRNTQEEIVKLDQDIKDLIDVLNAGGLPAELSKEPVSRQLMGATLGDDTIRKGQIALTAAGLTVLAFMILYYRWLGVLACFCVVLNLAMILAVMLAVRAAFTLPGLAGLVLTVGMAVDANILIFERLREELSGGASLRMAIRNAFSRATTAIVDSNLTTIITGVILYAVGTEQVKGFAVTLILGVVFSMFTAIYCSRTILEVCERMRLIRTLPMFQLLKRPNIDFLSARYVCYAASLTVILIGLVAVVGRGKGILDIDFVGGVSVEVIFTQPQSIDEIRKSLSKDLPDLAVSNIKMEAATMKDESRETGQTLGQNTHFIINTSIPASLTVTPEDYLRTVIEKLKTAFGPKLLYRVFAIEPVTDGVSSGEVVYNITVEPGMNHAAIDSLFHAEVQRLVADKTLSSDFAYSVTREGGFTDGDRNPYSDWRLTAHTTAASVEPVLKAMEASVVTNPYFPTSTTIGGQVASHARVSATIALLGSLVCIVLYIWLRFQKLIYGIAAAIALVHDVLVVLGLIALSAWVAPYFGFLLVDEFKIGLAVVAAFLTIIGYSLNDTIIIFDRIREIKGKAQFLTRGMINDAVNQTLSRTILTAMTTLFVVVILYIWGGQGIHTFAFALIVGVVAGTYSTIYIASALLYALVGLEKK